MSAREFPAPPPDDVPEPEPTDPILDPVGTLRVAVWAERLRRDTPRAILSGEDDDIPWVVVTTDGDYPYTYLSHADVAAWHVAPLITVAIAFRHEARASAAAKARAVVADALDGADAEGAAPFRDSRRG